MNLDVSRIALIGFLFLLILFFGFRLHRIGKPYSVILLNLHKLISLGTVILLAVTINKYSQAQLSGPILIAVISVMFLFIAVMIITGGLLSITKPVPVIVSNIHKVFPYISLFSGILVLYLLLIH